MRISDWSSDVCSSDLIVHFLNVLIARRLRRRMVRSTKPYPVSGAFLAHYVRGAFPVLSDEAIGRDHLGISKSRLSNLLNGVRPAGPHNLTTIARVVAASGAFQGLQAKPFATA